MTTLQTIPLNRLVHSKANVRHTGKTDGIEALMASIAANGLRQNLNVKPTTGNRFEVVAGGRRLEAMKRLAKDGRLDAQSAVNCLVLDEDENPTEISLLENAVREAMHPDDQCTAFQSLIQGSMPLEDVAARFGVTPTVVKQRLKLAGVSPVLRKLFRAGELDLSQMSAFALVDDHAAQEAAWEQLPEWNKDAEAIRHMLTKESLSSTHRFVRFIGIDAYEAAGGIVLRDLFDEDGEVHLTDSALVETLAIAKLEAVAAEVKAEGWSWVEIALKYDHTRSFARVYPARDDEGNPQGFAPEDIARAGAYVTLAYDGEASIERGLMPRASGRAEAARVAKAERGDGPAPLPSAVIEELTAHRTAALRLELAHNPAMGLVAVVHAMTVSLLHRGRPSCLNVHARSESLDRAIRTPEESSALAAFEGEREAWLELLPHNPAVLWGWLADRDTDRLLELLAFLAGLTVNAVHTKEERNGSGRTLHADTLAQSLALDMTKHWTPSATGFFSRLSKGMMIDLLTGAGAANVAAVLPKLKKAEAAQRTEAALKGTGWLPEAMMISSAAGHDDHGDGHERDAADDGEAAGDDDHDGHDD